MKNMQTAVMFRGKKLEDMSKEELIDTATTLGEMEKYERERADRLQQLSTSQMFEEASQQ